MYSFQAAILQQTAEYIYQLEQEKTRLLSQNSQLKRLYSLSQQGLSSPSSNATPTGGVSTGNAADDTTSPRLKKKRSNTTISLDNTSDLLKTTNSEDNAASTVAELSLQLLNEQRLRQRLEDRLKTLEQASNLNSSAPVTTQPPTNLLPTQPLKMEVVEKQQQRSTQPPLSTRPPPGTILLADKNGMQVKVEAVRGLPQVNIILNKIIWLTYNSLKKVTKKPNGQIRENDNHKIYSNVKIGRFQ